MNNWQPIETAPTMRQIIVAIPPITEGEGWTIGEAFLAKDCGWYWAGSTPGYHDSIQDANETCPTLWQPLPEPPTEQPKPTLMPVKDLPLGVRFSYQENPQVFVLLEAWGCGKCATEPSLDEGAIMQRVFSVTDTEEQFDQLEVLVHADT